jgi:tetrahydromethanopterin S-methyltransferase subunit G
MDSLTNGHTAFELQRDWNKEVSHELDEINRKMDNHIVHISARIDKIESRINNMYYALIGIAGILIALNSSVSAFILHLLGI